MPTITDLTYNQNTNSKRNQSLKAMKTRISYVFNKSTVLGSNTINLDSVKDIYNQFMQTKNEFNKLSGNNFVHYAISFSEEDTIGKKEVVEIIDKFLEDKRFDGFENFYGMHQDTDNIHCHLLINSVNSVTGKKWHLDDRKKDFLDMEIKLNKIAIDYGCKVPDKIAKILKIQQEKKINTKKTVEEKKEYEQNLKIHNKSWKQKTKNTIEYLIKNSVNMEDFINNSKMAGYNIYQNKAGQYIINIRDINKKISLEKLEINQDEMNRRFDFNKKNIDPEIMRKNIDKLSSINRFSEKFERKDDKYYKNSFENKNVKQYYKDLIADINKSIRDNPNLTEDYERKLYCVIKYCLNTSKTIQEAVDKIKYLGLDVSLDKNSILLDAGDIKISSDYLKIDCDKELDKPFSWKYDLFKKVNEAKYKSVSKEDFENKLAKDGITVKYNDERKYITFIDRYGNKRRNNKLYPPENFTKEAFEERFKKNHQYIELKNKEKIEYEEKRRLDEQEIKHIQTIYSIGYILKIIDGIGRKNTGSKTRLLSNSLSDRKNIIAEKKKGNSLGLEQAR